tara:strand:- start:3766 stop:4461 length:696 start_codon:yes stop_codon:yes gene_type:complete
MAGQFRDRIDALTGILVINGTNSDDDITDWLTDGLKQIIGILPPVKLEECTKTSTAVESSDGFNLDTATHGPVLSVTRTDTSGIEQTCRKIPKFLSSRVADPDDLMFSSTTDPVYYMDNAVVKILPVPTSTEKAYVIYITLTAVINGAIEISNFPDDVEYAVVLYASIKAAQSLLASEEDDDLYTPMINTLKADYVQAVNLLGGKLEQPKKASSDNAKMQNMLNQMLEYGK